MKLSISNCFSDVNLNYNLMLIANLESQRSVYSFMCVTIHSQSRGQYVASYIKCKYISLLIHNDFRIGVGQRVSYAK